MNINILTIVVLLVLAGLTALGYHKGLLHTIYSLLTGVLAMILVTVATPFMATFLTEFTSLDTRIEEKCHEQLSDSVQKASKEKKNNKKNGKEQTKKELETMGITLPEVVVDRLLESDGKADELLEKSGVYSTVSARITAMAINGIAFLIIMIVLLVVFRVIYQVFHIIEKLPVLKEANKGLGAALGLVKGSLLVWVFFAIVAMTGMSDFSKGVITQVYESPILIVIYENNIVLTLLMRFF